MEKRYLNINETARILNVSKSTLRKWDKDGILVPLKTFGNHRRYDYDEVKNFYSDAKNEIAIDNKLVIGYCRVSSSDQKDDLNRQVSNVETFCIAKGYKFKIIQDLGSGLNYKKQGLTQLIDLILSDEVSKVVVNYKDRLVRFGYEIIEQICEKHNVEIEIINNTEEKTFEDELVEDVLSLITVFSARLYGSRSKKSKEINTANKMYFTN